MNRRRRARLPNFPLQRMGGKHPPLNARVRLLNCGLRIETGVPTL